MDQMCNLYKHYGPLVYLTQQQQQKIIIIIIVKDRIGHKKNTSDGEEEAERQH